MTVTAETDLAFAGPLEHARLIRSKELHPRELVELFVRRIEALDPQVNAFRVVLAEQAWSTADSLAGSELTDGGPLAGVPVAIKDDMAMAGQATTFGSRSPAPVQAEDCEAVARLRRAGAIPLGVTNVPELMAWPWSASDANGITRNPWELSRTPGGSSGGSAAAVAAGLVSAATGTDGGGSIRIPAACCGLVGMKPTRGLVSTAPKEEMHLGLTVIGALARTVADSALMLDVMAGTDVHLPAAQREPEGTLKIAISTKLPPGFLARLSADQRLAFDRTARLLGELGHAVFERDPSYGLMSLEFTQTFFRGTYELYEEAIDPAFAERTTRHLTAAAGKIVSERRRDALRAKRRRTTDRLMALWNEADVLLLPVLSRTPLPAEAGYGKNAALALDTAARFMPWNPMANMTGQPSIAIPTGLAPDGLPTAVQLVGKHGSEQLLYSLAAQIEAAKPWASSRPPLG
jgi:amidase